MQIRRKLSTARSDEDHVLFDIEASEIRATHSILAVESMKILLQNISTPPPQPKLHEAVQQSTIVRHQSFFVLRSLKRKYRLRCSLPSFQALDKKLHMVWRWGLGSFFCLQGITSDQEISISAAVSKGEAKPWLKSACFKNNRSIASACNISFLEKSQRSPVPEVSWSHLTETTLSKWQ